jgi:hypothetical protein
MTGEIKLKTNINHSEAQRIAAESEAMVPGLKVTSVIQSKEPMSEADAKLLFGRKMIYVR